jgi:rhodanese-related sulfurtransferase
MTGRPAGRPVRLGLALAALILGVLAPVAGDRGRALPGDPGTPGVPELTRELESRAPVVEPLVLATWIRERRPLRLVDVRDSSAFVRFAIPTADRVAWRALPGIPVDPDRPLVLYDAGDGAAVRAWVLLRRLGHRRAYLLDGGVAGWVESVLSPVLPAESPEERARYRRVAEISRYFGGLPRIGVPPPPSPSSRDPVRLLTRRGCY